MTMDTNPIYVYTHKKGKRIKVNLNARLFCLEEIKQRIGLDKFFTPKQLREEMDKHITAPPTSNCLNKLLNRLKKDKFLKGKRAFCKGRIKNVAYTLTSDIYYNVLPKFRKAFYETAKRKLERIKIKQGDLD